MSMCFQSEVTNKSDSLSALTAPQNLEPGSKQKIALLRARASKHMSLFVEGEPLYFKPRDDDPALMVFDSRIRKHDEATAPCSTRLETTKPPQGCKSVVKRSRSGMSTKLRRALCPKRHQARQQTQTMREGGGVEEIAAPPLQIPVPLEVIRALEQMVESGMAIAGARQMLCELQAQSKQQAE